MNLDNEVKLRRLYYSLAGAFHSPDLGEILRGRGIDADYSMACRIAWEQVYAVHGDEMCDAMASRVLNQLTNAETDWSTIFMPGVVGITTKESHRHEQEGLNAPETRLSRMVQKLLEMDDGEGAFVGDLHADSEPEAMIRADHGGIEYTFWFRQLRDEYVIDAVSIDGPTGCDCRWNGDAEDALAVFEECLQGTPELEDMEAVS